MKITAVFTLSTAGVMAMAAQANGVTTAAASNTKALRGQLSPEDLGMIMQAPSTKAVRSLSSSTGTWVDCASDFQECDLNIRQQNVGKPVWVRYGTAAGRKMYRKAQGKAICSPHYFQGDPAPGKKKFCEYYRPASDSEETESEYQLSFRQAAGEGQDVNVPAGVYTLKYGPPSGPFLYTEVGIDDRSSKYPCGSGTWKFPDIAKNERKYCYLSTEVIRGPDGETGVKESDWTLCAHEGRSCDFEGFNRGGYLVRYGHGSRSASPRFVYMKVDDPDMSIHCGKNSFADFDPVPNQKKYCEYLPLKEAFKSHTGYWRPAGYIKPTASGGSYSEKISEGVSYTEGIENVVGFSRTLTSSISQKATYAGGETETSLSLSVTQSISQAMQKSTTFSSQRTCQIECNAGPNEAVYAYQWVMDSEVETDPATRESFETSTCFFQCTNDDSGPRCSLGMTYDEVSDKCVEGEDVSIQEGKSSQPTN